MTADRPDITLRRFVLVALWLPVAIVAIAVAVQLVLLPQVPPTIAIHWNAAGEADGTFLAAAGLARLGETGTGHPLDPAEWLPAPAQGAIAIECRTSDARAREWLAAIDHAPSRSDPRHPRHPP